MPLNKETKQNVLQKFVFDISNVNNLKIYFVNNKKAITEVKIFK